MIEKQTFLKLNIKQQIYKVAQCVRDAEKKLRGSCVLELEQIKGYMGYWSGRDNSGKMARAVHSIDACLKTLGGLDNRSLQEKELNMAFHILMTLIEQPVKEEDFENHSIRWFDNNQSSERHQTAAILDNLRAPFNVGSIFRSADVFGCGELALCGITPHPPSIKLEKAAMGTVNTVPWQYFKETSEAINYFRSSFYRIAAVETVNKARYLYDIENFEQTAFVFGNEEFGITDEILSKCDYSVQIPQAGIKNSMNVANCFSVVMYEVARGKNKSNSRSV